MAGCLTWLLLLPLAFAFWLVVMVSNACVKRGGLWRLLGILFSFIIGGICIQVGYWFTEEGMNILGWIIMIGGALIAILGTWTALVGTKEEIEQQEEMEKLENERKEEEQEWAKKEAEKILGQGEIDDYERLDWICNVLDRIKFSSEAYNLSEDLKQLKKKQVKRQKGEKR